jgi:hypothetical protein
MRSVNRYLEAFKENYNTLGIAAAVGLSLATLNPLPLLAGLVAEAAYMLVIPDSKWYQARLSRRFDAEIEQRRQKLKEQTLPTLRPEMQERFRRLEETRKQIDTQSQDDKSWYREILRKLDYLLDKFLMFASKEAQFHNYLQSLWEEIRGVKPVIDTRYDIGLERTFTDKRKSRRQDDIPQRPLKNRDTSSDAEGTLESNDQRIRQMVTDIQSHYDQDMTEIRENVDKEPDSDTKAVMEKRADVLQRRHEFVGKIGKILTNMNHQLQLVEDTFGLINDEIRARSPEQILADIEEVVVATDSMSTALEELAPYEQMAARVIG